MSRIVLLFIAIFIGEILLLLLASWIYNLLDNGVWQPTDQAPSLRWPYLPPVLCGLVFPAVIFLEQLEAGNSLFSPWRSDPIPAEKSFTLARCSATANGQTA
jgi:hypothetical protein